MNSIWTEYKGLPHFGSLKGNLKTDVLIIGGGMAGILCAYFLQEAGVDCVLVEGREICSGITQNTTAKITAQPGLVYEKLLRTMGTEAAKIYLNANLDAVQSYFELCKDIDCDFEEKPSYVYSLQDKKKLENEAEALRKLGYEAEFSGATELPFQTAGAVGFAHQAQFHPLKFAAALAKKLRIYEHTFVTEFRDHTAVTEKGTIAYGKAVFATHFPIDNKHGMYFLKMYQHRSYVIALENACKLHGMYVDEAKGGMSFRNYGELLFVGGGGHRTGKRGGSWQELRDFAGRYYPDAVEKYVWAAQDCMTLDGVPYIGRYAKRMPDCYVATGFNKWGMTSSMVAATLLTDMVLEKENPCAGVFDPSRSILKPQLFCNGGEALVNLLTPTGKRCTHLGCALKWNPNERSWDCPCHGSRFDENGKLLDNPANGGIKL